MKRFLVPCNRALVDTIEIVTRKPQPTGWGFFVGLNKIIMTEIEPRATSIPRSAMASIKSVANNENNQTNLQSRAAIDDPLFFGPLRW